LSAEDIAMFDLLFVLLTLVVFALSVAYVRGCERIG
jgi:hypothetical protein